MYNSGVGDWWNEQCCSVCSSATTHPSIGRTGADVEALDNIFDEADAWCADGEKRKGTG